MDMESDKCPIKNWGRVIISNLDKRRSLYCTRKTKGIKYGPSCYLEKNYVCSNMGWNMGELIVEFCIYEPNNSFSLSISQISSYSNR